MPSMAMPVQGTTIEISTTPQTSLTPSTPPTYAALDCTAREMTWQSGQRTQNDSTVICSTAKEKLAGLKDSGTLSLNGFWKPGSEGHDELKDSYDSDEYFLFRVTWVDGSTWLSLGQVTQRGWSMTVDGLVNASYSILLSGETQETPGP